MPKKGVHRALVRYVRKTHRHFPKDRIVTHLQKAGHTRETIEAAFKEATSTKRILGVPWHDYMLFFVFCAFIMIGVNFFFLSDGQHERIGQAEIDACMQKDEYNKNWCLFDLGRRSNRRDICETITEPTLINYCLALVLKDGSYCDQILVPKIRQECVNLLAIQG
ncbi:MAG: hypothetical protein KJ709_01600 [Nanoarchaeota archaeon]|nr:hypothetical protein [Nanoarchaeota archaeon]